MTDITLTNPTQSRPTFPDIGRAQIAALILLVFAVLVFLPGIGSIPPLDRDEPRFTQASRQMLDTGDFIDIRFQDEARHKKPAGIYWLHSATVGLIGGDRSQIWKYRMVSLLGAVLSVLLTFWMARAFLSTEQAFFAALLFASTILLGVEAHIAKTDAALLACIVAAQSALARLWANDRESSRVMPLLFWACIGVGILIKGPIILLVCGGTAAALSLWDRNMSWLLRTRPVVGVLIMLLIAAPWYAAIGMRTDGAFFAEAVGKDFLGKIATGQESHGAPPGLHLLVMFGTFWPASAFLIAHLPSLRAALTRPAVKFALCWAVPSWLVFELTATKLPHYVLPIFPALAMLSIALFSEAGARPLNKWLKRAAAGWLALVPVAILVGSVVVPLLLNNAIIWPAVILLAGAGGAGVLAARAMIQAEVRKSVVLASMTTLLVSFGAYGLALPQLPALWVSSGIVEGAKRGSKCDDPRLVSVGWREPSLVFLAGTETALRTVNGAFEELKSDDCIVVAIEQRHHDAFAEKSTKDGISFTRIGVVDGFALNGGDVISVALYQKTGPL